MYQLAAKHHTAEQYSKMGRNVGGPVLTNIQLIYFINISLKSFRRSITEHYIYKFIHFVYLKKYLVSLKHFQFTTKAETIKFVSLM